ncbi:MAG: insulinase family protein [Sphingomonadales bacterium]|nr:insulinase family protein [Sphingomonadales bacterium]
MRKSLAFVALLSLATLCVQPAQAATARPVPVSALVKAVNIPYTQFTLANGLRVIVHTDRKAPVVAISVWYDVGSKHEPKGKTGFAHLFEHLMFNGSENIPGDFFEPLQQIGATDVNGTTWFDRTNYFETVPTAALDRALFMEADRMGRLLGGITQAKLDNQRAVVQNEKRQGDTQPYGLTEYAQIAGLFPPDHPYGHSAIGSMADLDAASLEDVKNWFRQHYGPNNAVLVLAGDVDVPTAKALVEKRFGSFPAGPKQAPIAVPIPTLAAPKFEVMKDQVATTRLYRWWVAPGLNNPDTVPLSVGMAVLGGLASSRLDNALVRNEKLAVGVTASLQIFAQISIAEITADVRPGTDVAQVNKRLDALLGELMTKGPNADEVQRVATRTVASKIAGLESVGGFGGKAVALAEGALYSNDPDQYRKELVEYARATPAKVRAAMQKWLSRPVFALTVEPGERPAYEEAAQVNPPSAPEEAIALDPSKLPPVGSFSALTFPAIERAKLSNGIEVYFARRMAVPTVQVNVSFDAGFAADPKDALGTQALTLRVMREGTTTRNSRQLAEESERLGANMSSGAGLDRTSIGISALSANLGLSLDLLADVIRNPAFAPAEVDRVRAQQLAGIKAELQDPGAVASRVLPTLLWGKAHPYAVPGSGSGDMAVVKALTPAQLSAFHDRWLRPEKARIFVVGDTTLKTLVPLLEKSFGTWRVAGEVPPAKDFNAPIPAPRSRIVLVDRPNAPQSTISAGVVLNRSGRDDLVGLRAANEVFGGSFLSRINTDLRETKGWSYGVFSGIGGEENRITFFVQAPVQADRTGDSIRALRAQLSDFSNKSGITAAELERTVNGNIRELPGNFETSGAVLGSVQRIISLGRPDNFYETLPQKYLAMTASGLDREFRNVIDPNALVWVVVGDAKKVRPQLDGLGLPVEEMVLSAAN